MAKAKTKSNKRTKSVPIKWPKNGKLSSWLECYLDTLEQGKNPARSAGRASVPLRQLAELGAEAKALKRLDRLCELSSSDVGTWVRLSLVGAEISLENLKLKRAAIEKASAIKAGKKRRSELAKLFAKTCDWRQAAKQLDEAANEAEQLELIQTVIFEIPGGKRV